MKTFFLRLFTWWNGQTFGTQLWTWLWGEFVGDDEFGNRYFRTRGGKIDPVLLMERRWVIYNGLAEATMVPPSWTSVQPAGSSAAEPSSSYTIAPSRTCGPTTV